MTERFGGYQNEIYLQGLGGTYPPCSADATKLEASAEKILDPG
ncbi:alpha-hydroxy-acid oxidizing protein, partial [Amycolatopsis sp. H20-H5]|nr:alpha-hydroxy-acid oxidizing protein [Amycolatopsis sp. H20-H5]